MKPLRDEIAEIVGSFMGQQPHSFMVTVASQKIVELIHKRVSEETGYDIVSDSLPSTELGGIADCLR